jgi:GT2 family glycosyltransferase
MKDNVSIVVPTCNYEISKETLLRLSTQKYPGKYEILLICDGGEPSEGYRQYVRTLFKSKCKIIVHPSNKGLAYGYNEGINLALYDKIILIHEDCVPAKNSLVNDLLNGLKNNDVVNGLVLFPKELLKDYDFWNRMMLYRYADIKCQALGKITAFNRNVFLKVGYFDYETYRTAGEDMDFMKRCAEEGTEIGVVDNYVIHKHRISKKSSLNEVLRKAWQLGEGHGAYKRKYGITSRLGYLDFEIRILLLLIGGLIPFFILASYQSIKSFKKQKWFTGLITYPFIGTLILLTGTIAAISAYLKGKQTI